MALPSSFKLFLAGAALFSLPIVIEAAYNTLILGCGFGGCETTSNGFNANNPGGGGFGEMLMRSMTDIWNTIIGGIPAFAYLAGISLVIIGIFRMLKSSSDGARGPVGAGTVMTFIAGGALLSLDAMMSTFGTSLFNTGGNNLQTYSNLQFDTTGIAMSDVELMNNVLSSVLAVMMIIGWISFIRGFFILRKVADGDSEATVMSGMAHLFGGALAVNLGPAMNAIQSTFGVTGIGIGFT